MKITVYIPTHNYGRFVGQAIESVLAQTCTEWELIVINDGSTDDTAEILRRYEKHPKIRIIEQARKGLNVSNNVALRLSTAKYFMRLDGDDFLDENALLVLSNVLDTRPDVGLVYPDYYLTDPEGNVLEVVRRDRLTGDGELLDLPAHGACTMFRRECLLDLGGYAEEFDCQDGYDLWLRFIQSFKPANVNTPLFYYRQHPHSLTKSQKKIMRTRQQIKRRFVGRYRRGIGKVLALVPVLRQPPSVPESPFTELAGKPLIWHTLDQARRTPMLDRVAVTTNDPDVAAYCSGFEGVVPLRRPPALAGAHVTGRSIVDDALKSLRELDGYEPDAVMILHVNTPMRRTMHIEKAVDTLAIFGVDTVVAVAEELAFCYFHDKHGLVPIQKSRDVRIEKKAIYKETGALLLSRLGVATNKHFFGRRVGHVVMLPEECVKIKTSFDLWLAGKILTEWEAAGGRPAEARQVEGMGRRA